VGSASRMFFKSSPDTFTVTVIGSSLIIILPYNTA
jgi:hypothetical protein